MLVFGIVYGLALPVYSHVHTSCTTAIDIEKHKHSCAETVNVVLYCVVLSLPLTFKLLLSNRYHLQTLFKH